MQDPEFAWFLPTAGDLESFGKADTRRAATLPYLAEVGRAAEHAGFTSVLVPVGDACEDAWVVAGLVAGQTERLKFLVAVRPGFVAPTVAAKMVATFDQLAPGRLLVNVVTGGFPAELAADGDFTPHDERYARTGEFLEVMRKYWTERQFDHEGQFYRVEGCRPFIKCTTEPHPPLYAGGASDAAEDLFAREIDCYLLWGESMPQMQERISRMKAKASANGRTLRLGVRMHVLARETEEDAREAAYAQVEGVPEATRERFRATLMATDSAGESRQRAFAMTDDDQWVEPNLWAGVGQVRRGVGVTVVGSYEQVARKFQAYTEMGLSYFILSGYPHLEEAETAGRTWLPRFWELVRQRDASLAAG
ncbi:MAG: LLM class flavin-dependent oxidoreductase [Tepidiformaceae bacterium]